MAGTSLEPHSSDHEPSPTGSGELAHTAHDVVRYNPDAPSEEWGWHGSWRESIAPRGSRLLLGLGVVGLLLLAFFGNHVSHTEDYWVVAIALLMLAWMVAGEAKVRADRRRRP